MEVQTDRLNMNNFRVAPLLLIEQLKLMIILANLCVLTYRQTVKIINILAVNTHMYMEVRTDRWNMNYFRVAVLFLIEQMPLNQIQRLYI